MKIDDKVLCKKDFIVNNTTIFRHFSLTQMSDLNYFNEYFNIIKEQRKQKLLNIRKNVV